LKANDSRALKGRDRFNEDGFSTRDVSQNRAKLSVFLRALLRR